jgi:hypothetical protein
MAVRPTASPHARTISSADFLFLHETFEVEELNLETPVTSSLRRLFPSTSIDPWISLLNGHDVDIY